MMRRSRRYRLHRLISAFLLIGLVPAAVGGVGCAHRGASDDPTLGGSDEARGFEASCELALMRLEHLITMRSSAERYPPALLIEAKELHRMAKVLYLQSEYALALELAEEGISLVEDD